MDLFTIILYGAAGGGLVVSFVKSRKKTLMALKKAWRSFENILPQFLSVLVITGLMLAILQPDVISKDMLINKAFAVPLCKTCG